MVTCQRVLLKVLERGGDMLLKEFGLHFAKIEFIITKNLINDCYSRLFAYII